VTALGDLGLAVYLFCVSGSGSSEVAGDLCAFGVIHVMFALFCHVLGRFGKMICQRPILMLREGLQNDLPSGRPDVVFWA
jgi:hypothetical protein